VVGRHEPFEPELIHIPAGEFLMGSVPKEAKDAHKATGVGLRIPTYQIELPQHTVHLPEYYIAKTPVTNAQYLAFAQATDHSTPEHWEGGKPPQGKEDHPVVHVTWNDTIAYCNWLAEAAGKAYRLPTEAEWEKAARGTDGRIYPWGDEPPDEKRCNFGRKVGDTTPVGQYSPRGDSPYGCVDMAGNVWTLSLYKGYPYDPKDGREDLEASDRRVLRGGSWNSIQRLARVSYRVSFEPDFFSDHVGFRVVVAPVSSS
jgi:formylglycine-generating enzyme required for sulfatase activity